MNPVLENVLAVYESETDAPPIAGVAAALEAFLLRAPAIFSAVLGRPEVYAEGYLDWGRAFEIAEGIGMKDDEPMLFALASAICADDRDEDPVQPYMPLGVYAQDLSEEGFVRALGMLRARRAGAVPAGFAGELDAARR